MPKNIYSNTELTEIKNLLNKEIKRRSTFSWWDPLVPPTVGTDRNYPFTTPIPDEQILINDTTYTINNPSNGSIEPTRNVLYDKHGENPAGQSPDHTNTKPNTSAAQFNVDEIRNYLVGLSKTQDINLFYGRDEVAETAFRNLDGIKNAIRIAQDSKLNKLLHESDINNFKNDPNNGMTNIQNPNYPSELKVTYPKEGNIHVMPSGEFDGEESLKYDGPDENNFFDDHGAPPGDSNFKPINPYISPKVDRSWNDQGHNRDDKPTENIEGGISSNRFGVGPRNPQQGNQYNSRPVMGGVMGSCNVSCTGLCYQTCDNECSESCYSTCWNRCGNACTSNCGNVCTGCTTMCHTSCKTKCENSTGYSCLKVGIKSVKINSTGGVNGEPGKNNISSTTYSCIGCSYTCQFYPNKKTQCWDSACMGMCMNSCENSCSSSCFGGCIDNVSENGGKYKTGIGRGCSAGCTMNCIGNCSGVCEGECINSCSNTCKASCSDNCEWQCYTSCGSGCAQGCTKGCTNGCTSCTGSCTGDLTKSTLCGAMGCTLTCQHDCNKNCIGIGCKSICGVESAGACEANCRLNCMNASCTSLCSDTCSSQCTTCVNTCGFQCGTCSSMCSVGCSSDCNINCEQKCQHSCITSCMTSCNETCGGCSNLCYSCVGMCIGVCSVKCESGCSSCANNCGWWCDFTCNRQCFSNCDNRCISNCSGSCATFLQSNTTTSLDGPDRPPTSIGYIYPHPKNRWEERESFKLFREPKPPSRPIKPPVIDPKVMIYIDHHRNIIVNTPDELTHVTKQTTLHGGVYNIDQTTGEITVNTEMIYDIIDSMQPNVDGGGAIFIVIIFYNPYYIITENDVGVKLPFGFKSFQITDMRSNRIVIIERDKFLFPEEEI